MLACVNGCQVFIVHLFHRKELVFAIFIHACQYFNMLHFSYIL